METITHQEARSLIQYRADQVLDVHRKAALNSHLKDCVECADYASQVQATEAMLRITLRRHWNVPHTPLQLSGIKAKIFPGYRLLNFMTTRTALVGATLLFFVFAYWQFSSPGSGVYRPMPVGISPVPTPSLPLTSTQNSLENCPMIHYEVRPGDTLGNLASQFSASEEQIMNLNDMRAEAAPLPKVLIIPACERTPTSTIHPPVFTITPALEPLTYTPG